MTDVTALRAAARRRGAARPLVPFTGEIIDGITAGVGCRTYVPHHASPHVTAYFLHGGYGILGDLDLQDGYCRQVATELRCRTISVEYALAPEHTFDAAVTDLATLVHEERPKDSSSCAETRPAEPSPPLPPSDSGPGSTRSC